MLECPEYYAIEGTSMMMCELNYNTSTPEWVMSGIDMPSCQCKFWVKGNRYISRGGNCKNGFAFFLRTGLPKKERICSLSGSKFFPFCVDLFSEGFWLA